MFHALGRFTYRRRRLVAFVWLVVFAVGMAISGPTTKRLATDVDGSDRLESQQVAHRLDEIDPRGREVVAVVDGADVDDPAIRAEVEAAAADLRATNGVVEVLDRYSTGAPQLASTDEQASLVVVALADALTDDAEREATEVVTERLRAIDAPAVKVGGSAVLAEEWQTTAERDLQRGETIALPIALVAMVVIFGGLIAAGLPLIIAFVAVAGATTVLFAATGMMDVSIFALNVVFMFGIGLGIDYGLLMVSRFREERAAGHDVATAVELTVATAGRTVAFSALTVAAALAGLLVFDNPMFRSFALAGTGVVVLAMAVSVTLLPALLGMWGRRIKPARARAADHGYFSRLARLVQRRAVPVVVVTTIALGALALPFLGARFEMGDARSLPRSSETRAVTLLLAERFPARGADPVTVVADVDATSPELAAWADDLRTRPGVAAVTVRPDTPAGVSVVEIVPTGASQGDAAQHLVRALRDTDPGFPTLVGGTAAALIDLKGSIADRLPLALAVVAAATFVLLFLMTGSVAVPVKAILMNLLSLGASFGALVWVFQDGHLSGVLGFDPVGSIDLVMPVLIFIFAFGLSMDYEVFLIARIKEAYDETGDNDAAVAIGLQRTGRIITSAALLIVVVFAGFAMGEALGIKQLGFGMALAVIVDATVVRSLLVPATMKLLGHRNWWAPAPLRRIYDRFGLHEPASTPAPAPAPVPAELVEVPA